MGHLVRVRVRVRVKVRVRATCLETRPIWRGCQRVPSG